MSDKVCWILHDDGTWLIVLTWLRTCESLLGYDWLIVSWLTIVTSYDVMIFARDSYYESWVSRMWLVWAHDLVYEFWLVNGMLCDDSYESSMDFALWLTMSHRGLCSARWWVTRVRVVGRCLYKALGSDQEIGPRTISPPPPAIEISTPREIIVTFPHPPLFPHHGYCRGVDVKPSSLLSWGTHAPPPWGSCSRSSCSVLPLTPLLLCTSLSILHGRKASRFVHGRRYGVRTLGRSKASVLLGLYLW